MRFQLKIVIFILLIFCTTLPLYGQSSAPCTPREDWQHTYQVRAGDTLWRIAVNTGSTTSELAIANCIANPRMIYSGQVLRVPRAPTTTDLQIVSFGVTSAGNGNLNLQWETRNAAQVHIFFWLNQEPQTFSGRNLVSRVEASGTMAWQVHQNAQTHTYGFTLFAMDANGEQIRRSASLTREQAFDPPATPVACSITFFFTGRTTQDGQCAYEESTVTNGSYQRFERGFMVWATGVNASNSRDIYVLYDGGTWARYTDYWQESVQYTIGAPPAGLFAPELGFGYLWSAQSTVSSGLGWATGAETPYAVFAQWSRTGAGARDDLYLLLPNGGVVRLMPDHSWQSAS